MGIDPEEAMVVLKKEAEQTLDQLSTIYQAHDPVKFMPEGSAREDIIKTAENWGADLIDWVLMAGPAFFIFSLAALLSM